MMQDTDRQVVWEFFNNRLGLHRSEDFRGVVHIPDEFQDLPRHMDHVAVAVGYNSFIGRTCCMHTVIQRPELVTKGMVRETFEYPFVICDCLAVLALVDSVNDAALNFDRKLGFKDIATIPNGGTEGDLIILQMLREDCRWIRKSH
jgi:RimJ/RimL family protein N-acetyltransferase